MMPSSWQAGCCYGLAYSPRLLIRQGQFDLFRKLRELLAQYFVRRLDHDFSTRPCGYATENQDVFQIVEVRVMGNSIAQIYAEGAVDVSRHRISGSHLCLQRFKLLRKP